MFTEIVYDFDYLFGGFSFIGEGEKLLMMVDGSTYEVNNSENGLTAIKSSNLSEPPLENMATLDFKQLNASFQYHYAGINLFSYRTVIVSIIVIGVVLLFFT